MTVAGDGFQSFEDALFESLPLPALIHGPATILDVNAMGCSVLEAASREELAGLPICDVVHPDGQEAGEQRRELLLGRAHRFASVDMKLVSVKGNCVRTTGAAIPFTIGDNPVAIAIAAPPGSPAGLTSGVVPPMPHYHAGMEVRAAAVDVLPLPIVGVTARRIVYANPAACAMLGYRTPDELIGKSALDVLHADSREAMEERVEIMAQHLAPTLQLPLKSLTSSGECVRSTCSAFYFTHQGEGVFAFVATQVEQ